MQDVKLYSKSKSLQMTTTQEILEKSEFLSKWKNHDNIRLLDVGCGDGEALVRFLLPLVPGYTSAVAVDLLEEMICSCSARYGSVPRLTFRALDVTTRDLAALASLGKFSHIASTFCFHWIADQRQLFGNIYKLMLPGGQLFATLLRDTDLSNAVEELARVDKWAPFMANWRSYPSVYARNDQWEFSLREHLESAGLEQIEIKIASSTFDFKKDCNMKDFLRSVNPFVSKMPHYLKDEYIDEFTTACLRYMSQLKVTFEMIVLSAIRPMGEDNLNT